MAGLAAKLDLSTVKLRKTGISDQMLSDNSGSSVDSKLAILNPSFGLEYNTTHPVMLLQIKGELIPLANVAQSFSDSYVLVCHECDALHCVQVNL